MTSVGVWRLCSVVHQGAALDDCYSLAALALALHEIPRAWAQQARRGPRTMPMQVQLEHAQHKHVRSSPYQSGRCTAVGDILYRCSG